MDGLGSGTILKKQKTPTKGGTGDDTVSESGVWFLPSSLVQQRHRLGRHLLRRRQQQRRRPTSHSLSMSLCFRTPEKPKKQASGKGSVEEEDEEEGCFFVNNHPSAAKVGGD